MARLADISLKDVARACDHIRNLEQRPTVDRVMAILKKGSRTTINKFLRQHLREYEKSKEKLSIDIPSVAMEKIQEAMAIAEKDKREKIVELEEALKEKDLHIQEILKESEGKDEESQVQSAQLKTLGERHAELSSSIKKLDSDLLSKTNEIEFLLEFKDKFIAQKSRNDTIAEQINEYKSKIKELEKENRTLLERAIKAEK